MPAPENITTDYPWFVHFDDRGDLLWLDPGTKRPKYAPRALAEKQGLIPLYVKLTSTPEQGQINAS